MTVSFYGFVLIGFLVLAATLVVSANSLLALAFEINQYYAIQGENELMSAYATYLAQGNISANAQYINELSNITKIQVYPSGTTYIISNKGKTAYAIVYNQN